jgi:predicted DNA-binding transcriptional regulator YafY
MTQVSRPRVGDRAGDAAGIPVYAERGRRGGWRLVEGYRAQIPPLSASELGTLTVLGASNTLAVPVRSGADTCR